MAKNIKKIKLGRVSGGRQGIPSPSPITRSVGENTRPTGQGIKSSQFGGSHPSDGSAGQMPSDIQAREPWLLSLREREAGPGFLRKRPSTQGRRPQLAEAHTPSPGRFTRQLLPARARPRPQGAPKQVGLHLPRPWAPHPPKSLPPQQSPPLRELGDLALLS